MHPTLSRQNRSVCVAKRLRAVAALPSLPSPSRACCQCLPSVAPVMLTGGRRRGSRKPLVPNCGVSNPSPFGARRKKLTPRQCRRRAGGRTSSTSWSVAWSHTHSPGAGCWQGRALAALLRLRRVGHSENRSNRLEVHAAGSLTRVPRGILQSGTAACGECTPLCRSRSRVAARFDQLPYIQRGAASRSDRQRHQRRDGKNVLLQEDNAGSHAGTWPSWTPAA